MKHLLNYRWRPVPACSWRLTRLAVIGLTLSLAACGQDSNDPERQLTVSRIKFVNACTFYAGSENKAYCGCVFDDMVTTFGQEDTIRINDVDDPATLESPEDIALHQAMRDFMVNSTHQGPCHSKVVRKESRGDRKTFFQRLIPSGEDKN